MRRLLPIPLFLILSACAPKTETIYVDRIQLVLPELPQAMTQPVQPSPNPAKDPNHMTNKDIVKWWTLLRHDLQEANQKLLKIRVWHSKQEELVKEAD